jgi:flagellar motor component MotA
MKLIITHLLTFVLGILVILGLIFAGFVDVGVQITIQRKDTSLLTSIGTAFLAASQLKACQQTKTKLPVKKLQVKQGQSKTEKAWYDMVGDQPDPKAVGNPTIVDPAPFNWRF